MSIHFKLFQGLHVIYKVKGVRFLVLLITLFSFSFVTGQSNYPLVIALQVMPPYPPKVVEYTDTPGKIMATVFNVSDSEQSFYLQGKVTDHNGFDVHTKPGFKMSPALFLGPRKSLRINQDNIAGMFDANQLVYIGTDKNQLIYKGLPEGDYTICVWALDYATGLPLSNPDQGCSNLFSVRDIQPPVILSPVNGQIVKAVMPQSLLISWIPLIGVSDATYNVKVFEKSPDTRYVNEVPSVSIHPVFIEKYTDVPSALIGPNDPQFQEGKDYVILITGSSRSNTFNFVNNGQSEFVFFSYRKDSVFTQHIDTTGVSEMVDSTLPCVLPGHQFLIISSDENTEYELSKVSPQVGTSGVVKYDVDPGILGTKEFTLDYLGKMNANLHVLKGDNAGRVLIPGRSKSGRTIWKFEDDSTAFSDLEQPEVTATFLGSIKSSDPEFIKSFPHMMLSIVTSQKTLARATLDENGKFLITDVSLNITEPFDMNISLDNGNTYQFSYLSAKITGGDKLTMYSCEGGLELTTSIVDSNYRDLVMGKGRHTQSWIKLRGQSDWVGTMDKRGDSTMGSVKPIPVLITCKTDPSLENLVVLLTAGTEGKPVFTVFNDLKQESNSRKIECGAWTLMDLVTHKIYKSNVR